MVQNPVLVLRLVLRGREELPVVIVPDVLLVEARQVVHRPLLGHRIPHVPVGDEVIAVRIGVHEERDAVVEEALRLVVGAAHHLVDHLAELLRTDCFGGVEPAVDPDHRLAFFGEGTGLVVGEPVGQRETPGDFLQPRDVLPVLRRRDDCHVMRPALGGLADFNHVNPVRLPFELQPVFGDLLVVGEKVVVAEVVTELMHRSGDGSGR